MLAVTAFHPTFQQFYASLASISTTHKQISNPQIEIFIQKSSFFSGWNQSD